MRARQTASLLAAIGKSHGIRFVAAFVLPILLGLSAPGKPGRNIPVTGERVPYLESFDDLMKTFMEEHEVPGASLAVGRRGNLLYARGFGYADLKNKVRVTPGSLFRIASVSKPITGVAVVQLVEEGLVELDEPFLSYVDIQPFLDEGSEMDPRIQRITVRQLLVHNGGWDSGKSFDPMFHPVRIGSKLGLERFAAPRDICRFMLGRPLDFDPGSAHVYSNFGYCLLGRLIEDVTGMSYEAYVQERVLAPCGVRDMVLGRSDPEEKGENEVTYYDREGRKGRMAVGPNEGKKHPLPYTCNPIEVFDAHGGWLATASDLVRFASSLDDPENCPILTPKGIDTLFERPVGPSGYGPEGTPAITYYAMGWAVRPIGNKGINTWHTGAICGTSAILVRRWDGFSWAVLFNMHNAKDGTLLASVIDPLVHQAANKVTSWPERGTKRVQPRLQPPSSCPDMGPR